MKFKGHWSLKQDMPPKPVKQDIKMWLRSDSFTGYTYDFNIYTGQRVTDRLNRTLGERIVNKLVSISNEKDLLLYRLFLSLSRHPKYYRI